MARHGAGLGTGTPGNRPVASVPGGSVGWRRALLAVSGGGPGMSSRPFAESTQAEIDSEVSRLLREAEERAIGLLRAHQAELRRVVDLLLEKETVDGDAVYRALGMEPPEHRQEPAVLAPPQPVATASHAPMPASGAKGAAPAQQGPVPPGGASGP